MKGFTALTTAINAALFDQMQKFNETIVGKLCMDVEGDGSQSFGWLGAPPRMEEFMGELKIKDLSEMTYAIRNKNYAVALGVNRLDLSRDRLGRYKSRIQEMAIETVLHPWESMITAIEAGEATVCYDGQYFFDTDHADKGAEYKTSQSNDLTYNVNTATAPTVAEAKLALDQAIAALAAFKDDKGRIYHANPREGLMVLIPWSFYAVFRDVLELETTDNGGKNPYYKIADLHVDARSTWTTKFAVFKTDRPFKPLVLQHEPVEGKRWRVENTSPDGDLAITTDQLIYAVKGRYNIGYGQWRNAVLTTLT